MDKFWTLNMRHPTVAHYRVQWWGDPDWVERVPMGHENLGAGKHVKDWVGSRRTQIFPDGTVMTVDGRFGPEAARVSIYDADQTHRFLAEIGKLTVVWSCGLTRFGEADEPDGETSDFVIDAGTLTWRLIYQQDALPSGAPGQKVPGVVRLGELFIDEPNVVNDYYDDPRIGHT